ncbi:MAG TPA: glycosyl hydrolase [Cyclobacteriaceae bacterium]|nr:glycosyl hydrolase [Cyclobacteriaceae bacterium]
MTKSASFLTLCTLILLTLLLTTCTSEDNKSYWPTTTRETRPWTRWWWHGSALTKEGITAELEAYRKAGLGGVEITPIYGVQGYEDKFVPFLSDAWMDLLEHTLAEAERLDLGVDMATGTGWPFGGPWVKEDFASRNIAHKVYDLGAGNFLNEKIEFIQQPLLRTVLPNQVTIKDIAQPVESNKNLQELAIDQVQFERSLPLVALMGYNEQGEVLNLTKYVNNENHLNWSPPSGKWKLYALFIGWHGKMVERAGPGGEGNVIDHFSDSALYKYLLRFDNAFRGRDITSIRAFFNDSYEVDDAQGAADWTPKFLEEFKKARKYNLEDYLPLLFGPHDNQFSRRVLYDYRLTISELVFNKFTQPWDVWAQGKKAITRNQAHGSPSNILDLYSRVDIPEIEGTDPLRIRMASSAGNVSDRRLVSSESATWLDEHFESGLGDIKSAVDLFMLNGVNHIFYHGTTYSPPGEEWPGWLFYAAVHLNPRNPQWADFDVLNNYITRCQSFLQKSKAINDVVLYYPIADPMSTFGPEMIEHFDGIGKQFAGSVFEQAANSMLRQGVAFDFISDKQIRNLLQSKNGQLVTVTNRFGSYKTIVVPYCEFIPIETLKSLIRYANDGATIIMYRGVPYTFAGFANLEKDQVQFDSLMSMFRERLVNEDGVMSRTIGKGKIVIGDSLTIALGHANVERESMTDLGLEFTRRILDDGRYMYMVRNVSGHDFDGWVPFNYRANQVVLMDPMTGVVGLAEGKGDGRSVRLQLADNQTMIVVMGPGGRVPPPGFPYITIRSSKTLDSKWTVKFESGGPTLPPTVETDTLGSWTWYNGKEYDEFSGTAVYQTRFASPDSSRNGWMLDLGRVYGTVRVILNGKEIGAVIAPPFRVKIEPSMAQSENILEVRVTNLMANRIAALDKNGVKWKKFYNINFPARKAENRKDGLFDASSWVSHPSGLMGPVQLLFIE